MNVNTLSEEFQQEPLRVIEKMIIAIVSLLFLASCVTLDILPTSCDAVPKGE